MILHTNLAVEPQDSRWACVAETLASGSQSKTTTNETPSRKSPYLRRAQNRTGKHVEFGGFDGGKASAVEQQAQPTQQLQETLEQSEKTRLIHIFDREGDIAEVFDQVRQMEPSLSQGQQPSLDPAFICGSI